MSAAVIMALFATPALALAEPSSVSLDDIVIFHDLLTPGDMLATVPYNVSFATAPDENISQTFIFTVLSPDGSTVNGTALAYPAYNGGYGPGLVAFYWASGMVSGESYIFRVQENPVYYPAPDYWDFPVSVSNYSTETDQAVALKTKILDSSIFLSTSFGVPLSSTSESGGLVLSAYGELYYLNVIPGLQQMTPTLFSVQLEDPDFTRRSWSTSFADALKTKYEGTILYDAMTGFGGLFSVETTGAMTIVSVFIFLVVVSISVLKFKGSMISAFDDGYTALLLLMLYGVFDMILAGTIAFISTAIGGVILFLNRS